MEFKNVKFLPKGDIAANWDKAAAYIPNRKEIIEYLSETPGGKTRIKIGDGETTVGNLPFLNVCNIEDGTNKGTIQQIADGVSEGFNFTGKNANASSLFETLKQGIKDKSIVGDSREDTILNKISADNLDTIITYGAVGAFSSALGGKSAAFGKRSHAEGTTTIAIGQYSHAEGDNSVSLGNDSHAEGYSTTSAGTGSHTEGSNTVALGAYSHAEGINTTASTDGAHAEGYNTRAIGEHSHAEGNNTEANGVYSHTEGVNTYAAAFAHAEGHLTRAEGDASHTEGANNRAVAKHSHAEGYGNTTFGMHSHVEGVNNIIGEEGSQLGAVTHVEGSGNKAFNDFIHISGLNNTANGYASFVHGMGLTSNGVGQTVIGKYNKNSGDTLFEIGNGENKDNPSNIVEVYNNTVKVNGTLKINDVEVWNVDELESVLSPAFEEVLEGLEEKVDLTSKQQITGEKTFLSDIVLNYYNLEGNDDVVGHQLKIIGNTGYYMYLGMGDDTYTPTIVVATPGNSLHKSFKYVLSRGYDDGNTTLPEVQTLATREWAQAYMRQYIKEHFAELMAEYLNSTEATENKPTVADITEVFNEDEEA